MALIKHLGIEAKLPFMAWRTPFLLFSIALMIASVALFVGRGLNFGVDFRGGILIEVKTVGPANIGEMRDLLGGLDLGTVTLQEFGGSDDVLINLQRQDGEEEDQIQAIEIVKDALGDRIAEYRRTEFVGPKVGGELKEAGALATVLALLVIGVYIWFRFEWQFSVAALIALLHDVIATVGFYSLTQVEFNLATLAAVLMIAGYSINDTVVIFDRVRENLRKFKKMPLFDLLNLSINQTLSRTILTSFTTLLALIALFLFGGPVIRGFTTGLIWGICIGTYSSIALAVPLLARFKIRDQTAGGEASSPAEKSRKGKPAEAG